MSVNTDVELLQRVPMFAHVDPAHLKVLVFSSQKKTVSAGSFVLKKGSQGNAGFLVISGKGIVRRDNKGASRAIARVQQGAFVGEMSMIGGVPSPISVQAVDDMVLLKITKKIFFRVCEEFPDVGVKVLAVLTQKLDGSLNELRGVQDYFDNARKFTSL